MAGHPAREGELTEQARHTLRVPAHVRVGLGIRALQPGVGQDGRSSMAGAPDTDGVLPMVPGHPVEVRVHEIQTGRGAPVAQQPRLDVLRLQWLTEQRIGHQVDLPDGQVVCGPPMRVQRRQLCFIEVVG